MKQFMALVLVGLMMALPLAAQAADKTAGAKALIDQVGREAMDTIKATKDNKLSNNAAKEKFRGLLNQSFDIPTIARFTLGRYWRVATAAEQQEFTGLVQDIIINKYADRVLNASSGTYEITSAKPINEHDYAVLMTVKPVDDSPIALAWRVRDTKAGLKIIDLAVEGVSMSITNRADFASVIERNGGSVGALIDALKAKR